MMLGSSLYKGSMTGVNEEKTRGRNNGSTPAAPTRPHHIINMHNVNKVHSARHRSFTTHLSHLHGRL